MSFESLVIDKGLYSKEGSVLNQRPVHIVYRSPSTGIMIGIAEYTHNGQEYGVIGKVLPEEFISGSSLEQPKEGFALAKGFKYVVFSPKGKKESTRIPDNTTVDLIDVVEATATVMYNGSPMKISTERLKLDLNQFDKQFIKPIDRFVYCNKGTLVTETTVISDPVLRTISGRINNLKVTTSTKSNYIDKTGPDGKVSKVKVDTVEIGKNGKNVSLDKGTFDRIKSGKFPLTRLKLAFLNRKLNKGSSPTKKSKLLPLIRDIFKVKKPRTDQLDYLGLELELFWLKKSGAIEVVLNRFNDFIDITTDASLSIDDNNYQPYEIRVCLPEVSYKVRLKELLDALVGAGAIVNRTCGGHVHFDMRKRDVKVCYANLFASRPLINKLVSPERLDSSSSSPGRYCIQNKYRDFDKEQEHLDGSSRERRRTAFNIEAYSKHKTLEVRIKEGSLDYNEITGWIDTLLNIISLKTKASVITVQSFLTKYCTNKNAAEYVARKTA